jgi:WD40 repeat protein
MNDKNKFVQPISREEINDQTSNSYTFDPNTVPVPAFFPQNQYLIAGGDDGKLRVWTNEIANEIQFGFLHTFQAHQQAINVVCVLDNIDQLATASIDGQIKIWNNINNTNEFNLIQLIEHEHVHSVNSFCYLNDLDILISGHTDHAITIRQRTRDDYFFNLIFTLNEEHRTGAVNALIRLPNNHLASGSANGLIKVWEMTPQLITLNMQRQMIHNNNNQSVRCLIHSSDFIISGSDDETIKLWNYLNGDLLQTLPSLSRVFSLILLDNNEFASGSSDDKIRIWSDVFQIPINGIPRILQDHGNYVLCMTKINNEALISGSQDRTVKIWNLNDNFLIQTLNVVPGAAINSIVYYQRQRQN